MLGEVFSIHVIGAQRFGLAAVGGERGHKQTVCSIAQRIVGDMHDQSGRGLAEAAGPDQFGGTSFDRHVAELGEVARRRFRPRLGSEFIECVAVPHRKRRIELFDSFSG